MGPKALARLLYARVLGDGTPLDSGQCDTSHFPARGEISDTLNNARAQMQYVEPMGSGEFRRVFHLTAKAQAFDDDIVTAGGAQRVALLLLCHHPRPGWCHSRRLSPHSVPGRPVAARRADAELDTQGDAVAPRRRGPARSSRQDHMLDPLANRTHREFGVPVPSFQSRLFLSD